MEAISLASSIVQFTQVAVVFFTRFLALCRSANGTTQEFADRETQIQAILVDIAALEARPLTQAESEHVRACQKVLKQMSQAIGSTKGDGRRHVISNVKAAARAMRVGKQFEQLDRQLSVSIQGLQLWVLLFPFKFTTRIL